MVTLVKHEWHHVDVQYAIEIDEDVLGEIYPDLDEDEIADKLQQLADGEIDVEDIVNDAMDNDVELEWDFGYDDCWTDRKGGYDVTYEIDNDYEPVTEPEDLPKTHKCTKCRWEGGKYQTRTQYYRADGTVIEDYWDSEEDSHHDKEVCPMCDSDVELTEVGKEEKERHDKLMAEFDAELEAAGEDEEQ